MAQQTGLKTHTVEAGNTYYSIAKQYGVTIEQIKKWNNITTYSLKPGEVLIVSNPDKVVVLNEPPLTETKPANIATKDTTANAPAQKDSKPKPATIEDLGFRVSEIDTTELKNSLAKLLPAKADTSKNNIIFCGGVEDDKPVGISSVFFNNRGQNYVYVFVEKDSSFGAKNIIADLFLKNEDGSSTKISTTNYEVKPKWTYTIFKHFIAQPGLYEIVVYDYNRKKIGDGQVRILQ